MAIAVVTGILLLSDVGGDAAARTALGPALALKLALVGVAASLAFFHQLTARRSTPAVRGIVQGLVLLVSIGIFGAAIAL